MNLSNIYFILVRPQMGENIGSVARAIKNFNIKYLRLVNPRCNWPNQKALATSVGAKDVLKAAKIYDSVEKCQVSFFHPASLCKKRFSFVCNGCEAPLSS